MRQNGHDEMDEMERVRRNGCDKLGMTEKRANGKESEWCDMLILDVGNFDASFICSDF